MRFAWFLAIFPLLALSSACGRKSLLGVKNAFEVSMSADNQSDFALRVTLALDQATAADNCEKESERKVIDVKTKATLEESLSLKCEHPPRNAVSLALNSPADPTNPVQWATVSLENTTLKAPLTAGTAVSWHVDQTTLRTGQIGSFDWLDVDGVKTPPDEPTRVAAPVAAALLVANVHAAAKKVQIYFAPDTTVVDVGLPMALFDSKPDSATERDGLYYFAPRIETFGGALALSRNVSAAKVTCANAACSIDLP